MNDSVKKLTIGGCETQPVTAEGLRSAIDSCADLHFVGNTITLGEAAEMVTRSMPDVIIVDKAFGSQAVLDFVRKTREARPSVAVVVWATSITEAEALRFLQQGARGILRKTADLEKLLICIRSVGNGTTWMQDSVFREAARPDSYPRSELTARERQVMELVEQGLKNKDIAGELGIRPGTVKIHLKHIFEKTGVRGRYGLALSGLRHKGVISMMTV
jgi:two-component system nitrate/nitrite response regulator NarL